MLLCLPAALLACVTQQGLVTQMYQERFDCPAPQVRDLGKNRWEARGCGHLQEYDCGSENLIVESKVSCREIPDPITLVQRMARENGCNEVDVSPVDGSGAIYQARGCGRRTLYECTTDANRVLCKAHQAQP